MEQYHGTTILSARRGRRVALGGDGQVTLGNIVVKASARKVRRLYTVMEKLLEEVSFDAGSKDGISIQVDAAYVDARLADLAGDEDLSRYVL